MHLGFSEFQPKGHYLIASENKNEIDSLHVGKIRVSFEYDRCGPATIIAKQITRTCGDRPEFTFKCWGVNNNTAKKDD